MIPAKSFYVATAAMAVLAGCAHSGSSAHSAHSTPPLNRIAGLEDFLTCSISEEVESFLRTLESGTSFKIDEKNDHFYMPVGKQYVFGFEVTYFGPYGRMDAVGPNVGLRASRSAVVEALRAQRDIELQCEDEGCYHQISEELGIVVFIPPEATETAVLMCAYTAM